MKENRNFHENFSFIPKNYGVIYYMLMDLTEKASPDRKVFSKSMKKLIGMNDPVAANYTRYLQRSNSGFQKRTINLPVLGVSALSIRTSKDKTALPILLRQSTEKSA
jgi:hypothetical protein